MQTSLSWLQTNSRVPKHLSSEWPVYVRNNNNKMLTNSPDKVVSGCFLVYGNVFTVSVPFQAVIENGISDHKFVSPNSCV